jgi:hypothetical protein
MEVLRTTTILITLRRFIAATWITARLFFAQVFKCLRLFLPNDSLWVDNYWDSQAEKYLRAMYEKTTDIVAAQTVNSCVLCNCYRKIM